MAPVGIGEMARMLERDPKALRHAVKVGRITQRPDGLFDPETVMQEWAANTHHEAGHNNRTPKVVTMDAPDTETPKPEASEAEAVTKAGDYAKARAVSWIYEARLKKLTYDEKVKSLVPARDVEDAAHKALRSIRDACMAIPSRIASQLACESSVERCYQLLDAEIAAVFDNFAEGKIA